MHLHERYAAIGRSQRMDRARFQGGLMSFVARSSKSFAAVLLIAGPAQAQTPQTPQSAPAQPASAQAAPAQQAPPAVVAGIPVNYDESKVGTYTLPDPLVTAD